MKKLFIFAVLSLCSLFFAPCSSAQGNLQFNQVINEMRNTNFSSGSGGGAVTSTTFTVPTGKVWKVEGFYQGLTFVGAASGTPGSYIINSSAPLNFLKRDGNGDVLWLPAGTYAVRFSWGCGSASCSGTVYSTVNAIEFNVVP
jgi:hypothetical protein